MNVRTALICSRSRDRAIENPQPAKSSPARPMSAPTQRPTSAPPSPYLLPSAYKCGSPASLPNYTADSCEPGERNPSSAYKSLISFARPKLLNSELALACKDHRTTTRLPMQKFALRIPS